MKRNIFGLGLVARSTRSNLPARDLPLKYKISAASLSLIQGFGARPRSSDILSETVPARAAQRLLSDITPILKVFLFSVFCSLFSVFCPLSSAVSADLPFSKGETISYRIQWKGVRIGSAKLIFGDEIVLQTNTLNFKDVETIKGDVDYHPIEVNRDIRLMGKSIQILEKYDQEKKRIEILRKSSGKIEKQIINSDAKIHHPILLIYYCRSQELKIGKSWTINLPLVGKYKLKVTKLEKIKTPAGKYLAYRIESFPSEIKFWISADERKLPLKIEKNDSFFTHSSFVMTNFSEGR